MPKMKIWNRQEIAVYDNPPKLNTYQRKLFFTPPSSLEKKLGSLYHHTNQIGFYLMLGYFKACRRFFTPARFHKQDIEFICTRLGIFSFGIDINQYNRKTYLRHKQMILDHFAYEAYNPNGHDSQISQAIERQVQAQFRPRLIIGFLLEWLEQKRIELPTYNSLQNLITHAIQKHKQSLIALLKKHLILDQKEASWTLSYILGQS